MGLILSFGGEWSCMQITFYEQAAEFCTQAVKSQNI